MKKTLYITAFAAMLAGSMLTSCSDFLETKDLSSGGVDDSQFFSTNPQSLLTSAYVNLKTYSDVKAENNVFDAGTDLYQDQTRSQGKYALNTYMLTPEDGNVKDFYVTAFSCINYANGAIKYAGADSKIGAEARFLRAYTYYQLTQQFGAVPYTEEFIQNSRRNYPRTALSVIYDNIIKDLDDLIKNSPLEGADNESGHPSKLACKALLAKVYLAAGWDLDTERSSQEDIQFGRFKVNSTENFKNAAEMAKQVVGGMYTGQNRQSFYAKWNYRNQSNQEVIFSIKYPTAGLASLPSYANNQASTYGGYYSPLVGCDSRFQQSKKTYQLFEKGDERYEVTFMTTFHNNYYAEWPDAGTWTAADKTINYKYFPSYYTEEDIQAWVKANKDQLASNVIIDLLGVDNSTDVNRYKVEGTNLKKTETDTWEKYNGYTNAGVKVRKFDDPINQVNCFHDIILIDASDIQLTLAEAELMADNESGFYNAVNAIRDRAGMSEINNIDDYEASYAIPTSFVTTDKKQKMLDYLLDERARELYAQKVRWVDLRRTNQIVRYNLAFNAEIANVTAMQGVDGKFKVYRPIPQGELENNEGMTAADQNEGYVTPDAEEKESEGEE